MANSSKYKTVLENAFKAGNKKAIGATPIEDSLKIPFGGYCNTMLALQDALHVYISVEAIDDKTEGKAERLTEAKTKVYDLLKGFVELIPNVVCEASDVLYLKLAAYKLAKAKDTENTDGSIVVGTKRLAPVSFSSFRVIVESLLGNKIVGNTWDVGMGDFRKLTEAEREKIAKKLAKKQEKAAKPAPAKKETKPVAKDQPKQAPKDKKNATAKEQAKPADKVA